MATKIRYCKNCNMPIGLSFELGKYPTARDRKIKLKRKSKNDEDLCLECESKKGEN